MCAFYGINMKQRNDNIDLLKGICCIAVVLIHYNLPGSAGIVIKTSCRFAVPYFFFISGYYLLNHDLCLKSESVKRKAEHIFKLIVVSAAYYAFFCIVFNKCFSEGWTINNYIRQTVTRPKLIKLIITNDPLAYSHLWFLLALLYIYVLFIVITRWTTFPKHYYFTVFSAIFLLVGYTCMGEFGKPFGFIHSSYTIPNAEPRIYSCNAFIFRALPTFLAGYILRQNKGGRKCLMTITMV